VARDVHHGMFLDGSRGWAPYRNAAPVVPCDLVDATDDIMRGFGKDWALKSPDGKYRVVGEEGNEVLDNEDDALAWFSDVRAAESAATSSPTPPPAA
jgi:hypothetical protein